MSCTQGELDAVEQKQQFDAQLLKANTDAAEFKAQFDKVSEQARGCVCHHSQFSMLAHVRCGCVCHSHSACLRM